MHLKSANHESCLRIIFTGLVDPVSVGEQGALYQSDVRQVLPKLFTIFVRGLFVIPGTDTLLI